MSLKQKIIIGAVVALLAGLYIWRRRAQASMVYGQTAATPTPQTALTTLLATPPSQLAQAGAGVALGYAEQAVNKLLPVGTGTTAVLPQSVPKPNCPPGFRGTDPSTGTFCTGTTNTLFASIATAAKASGSANYSPQAGYFG